MKNKTQLIINIIAAIFALISTFIISFYFTPYIVNNIGPEAYGFFKLANNFSEYTLIITFTLNAMVARFITIKIQQGDIDGANKYFTSAFYTNIVIVFLLSLPIGVIIVNLDKIIQIPNTLVRDVKFLFSFIFINLGIKTILSVFGSSFYASNKLYISSIIRIVSSLVQVLFTILFYVTFSPKIMYMGLGILISGVVTNLINITFKNKLLPMMKINRKYYDKEAVKNLLKSGFWFSLNRLSGVLLDGLDLLIANIFLGATPMAIIALAKTAPGFINSFIQSLVQTFSPNLTILYANNKKTELLNEILFSMKLIGFLIITPVAGFISVGEVFYALWVPTQNEQLLQSLSIFVILSIAVIGVTSVLKNVFITMDEFRIPSLVILASGILSTVIVLTLLYLTDLGIWAVVGVSVVISTLRELFFTIIYASKLINISATTFYRLISRIVLVLSLNIITIKFAKVLVGVNYSWSNLIIFAFIIGILSYLVTFLLIFTNSEKRKIIKYSMQLTKR